MSFQIKSENYTDALTFFEEFDRCSFGLFSDNRSATLCKVLNNINVKT